MFVDYDSGSLVASAEAGHGADLHARIAGILTYFIESRTQITGPAKMARHILANAHVRYWWRRQAEVGIETRDSVQPIKRHVDLLRETLQLIGRHIAELALNLS